MRFAMAIAPLPALITVLALLTYQTTVFDQQEEAEGTSSDAFHVGGSRARVAFRFDVARASVE